MALPMLSGVGVALGISNVAMTPTPQENQSDMSASSPGKRQVP